MGIWYRRPLFRLCSAWIAGMALGYALYGTEASGMFRLSLLCIGLAAIGGLSAVICTLCRRKTAGRYRRMALQFLLLLLVCSLSLSLCGLYFDRRLSADSFPTLTDADDNQGSIGEADDANIANDDGLYVTGSHEVVGIDTSNAPLWHIKATVTQRMSGGSQITAYGVIIKAVNDTPVGNSLNPARAYLVCGWACDLQPGYCFTMDAYAVPLTDAAGDVLAVSLTGDGYSLGLAASADCTYTVITENDGSLSSRFGRIRREAAALIEQLIGPEGGGLPSALLLGERSYLDDAVRRDFTRAGVSHLLAISGLHITLLFGLWAFLLRLTPLPKRVRACMSGLLAIGYLCFLGFPPSATRAVVMLGMVYLSWLCFAQADPLTSLGLAGALILGFSPCTVADAGFWMSFSATLGLVTVMPLISARLKVPSTKEKACANRNAGKIHFANCMRWLVRRFATLLLGFVTGVVAMTFSLWITSRSIGQISLLSPVTTLILTPLCALLLVGCLLILLFRHGFLANAVLIPAVRMVSSLMRKLAHMLGRPAWVIVSLKDPDTALYLGYIIALMTAALLVLLGIRLSQEKKWVVCLPMLCGWLIIGLILGILGYISRDEVNVTYVQPSTASEALILTRGQQAFICDLSNGSNTALRRSVSLAEADGATEVSVLMLTHYHSRMPGTLWNLLSSATVRVLWLPAPDSEQDFFIMLSCLEKAQRCDVPVYIYRPGETLSVYNSMELCLDTSHLERSTQPVMLLSLQAPDGMLTWCSGAVFESDLAAKAVQVISESDTVIFGSHGPLCKQSFGDMLSYTQTTLCFANTEIAAWYDTSALPDDPPVLIIGQLRVTYSCALSP